MHHAYTDAILCCFIVLFAMARDELFKLEAWKTINRCTALEEHAVDNDMLRYLKINLE